MKQSTVSVTELGRNLSDYLNRVVYRGERFVLTRGNKAIAELRALPRGRTLGDLPDLWRSLPRLGPEDATQLERDLDEARTKLAELPRREPWDS
jgi:antitoxin (DNA-binding transcriptional repressor) of toxin-antitoxin stability system